VTAGKTSPTDPTKVLVLGGTRFLGRAVVDEALQAGCQVTLFNRGITKPDLFPTVEKLRGDRTSDLSALSGRRWNAVIDVAAYEPSVAARSVEVLRHAVDRYVFVSTLSVYADHSTTDAQLEDSPVLDLTGQDDAGSIYGAKKALCEAEVVGSFGDRATVARAGLIVGPHDPTDRFVCWPRRMAEGGRVLAPGDPEDPLQFVDVRDLARWLVAAATTEFSGIFNVTGLPIRFVDFLAGCAAPGVDAELVWIASDRLLGAGLDPWMGVPLWIAGSGWEAANAVDVSRAVAVGLRNRPITETIEGALTFPGGSGALPLAPRLEADLLGRLAAS
jgi:2'-hydroxyisoflavone reductase